jgi:hypothetical protein
MSPIADTETLPVVHGKPVATPAIGELMEEK